MDTLRTANDILNAADDALRAAERVDMRIKKLQQRAKELRVAARVIERLVDVTGTTITYGLLNTAIEVRSKIATEDGISPGHNLSAIRRLQAAMTEMLIIGEGENQI